MKTDYAIIAIIIIVGAAAIIMVSDQNPNAAAIHNCPPGYNSVVRTDVNYGQSGAMNIVCVPGKVVSQQYKTFPKEEEKFQKYTRFGPQDAYTEVY